MVDGTDYLARSAVLEFENSQHPLVDRRTEIVRWAQRAVVKVTISGRVSARAQTLAEAGFGALDAAHIACANAADGLEAPAVAAPERHEDAKGENLRLLPAPAVVPHSGVKTGGLSGRFRSKLQSQNHKRKFSQCSGAHMTSYRRFHFTEPKPA